MSSGRRSAERSATASTAASRSKRSNPSEMAGPGDIVGVIGAGTMGAGIAQLALEAGHPVWLHDVDEAAIEHGRAHIRTGLERRAARLDLDAESANGWVDGRLAGLHDAPTLADVAAAGPTIVIEAAVEDLGAKRTIFHALDAATPADAILATNTSALSVAAIAAAAATHPERVVGLHFFNPAPVMALVEVVSPPLADPAVVARAVAIVTAWGKTPVVCADRPGFIVNRVNRPFTIEALRILESGAATVSEIDDAVRAGGFPMGPFELMDLTGIDVTLAAATGIWEGLGRPDRLRPSPIQALMVEAGTLGRKTGQGFYQYADGKRLSEAPATHPAGTVERISPAQIRERIVGAIAV